MDLDQRPDEDLEQYIARLDGINQAGFGENIILRRIYWARLNAVHLRSRGEKQNGEALPHRDDGDAASKKGPSMSRSSFLKALRWQPRLREVPFTPPELEAFVDYVWPVAVEDCDVDRWAREYACALAAAQ